MTEKKKIRRESQINAEQTHESHRINHKLAANKKTNPIYAEKFQRYKESGKLTALLHEAILNAPENPDDFIPTKTPKK